jgi:hypothetical protein
MSKHPKLIVRPDGTYRLDDVRLSYPHLFRPYAGKPKPGDAQQQQKKYKATLLIPLSSHKEEIIEIRRQAILLAREKLAPKGVDLSKWKPADDKLCIRNGSGTGQAEQEGHWILSASESTRPATLGAKNEPVAEEDGVLYAGCYVSVNFRLWAMNNDFGKRINANLLAVKFMRKGDPLATNGPRPDVSDVFSGMESEEDDGLGGGDGLGGDDFDDGL